MPAFNLELVPHAHKVVQVATSGTAKLFNYSKLVVIPFLTNSTAVSKGDELILQISLTKKKPAKGTAQTRFSEVQKNKESQTHKRSCR